MSHLRTVLLSTVALSLGGCDYSGDWLFSSPTETVPGVIDIGHIASSVITTAAEMEAATIYGEVGAVEAEVGGVTFSFDGDGTDKCVFVDPEIVYWNQSVSAGGRSQYSYPDNIFDDGDFDLFAGYSVYYNGSPGIDVGSFEVQYEDTIGNQIPIEFNECTIVDYYGTIGGHAGRGRPEYCTINNTNPGVRYTVLMETFSLPPDDGRLGYGLVLADGKCTDLISDLSTFYDDEECYIRGEGIQPGHGHDYRDPSVVDSGKGGILAVGYDQVKDLSWGNSVVFEDNFCSAVAGDANRLPDFCKAEADANDCNGGDRCFCGDLEDTPSGGSK